MRSTRSRADHFLPGTSRTRGACRSPGLGDNFRRASGKLARSSSRPSTTCLRETAFRLASDRRRTQRSQREASRERTERKNCRASARDFIASRPRRPPAFRGRIRGVSAVHEELEGIPKPGEVLDGKYEVEGVLGAGGMGVVLAARQGALGQRVAVKFLLPEVAKRQPEEVERFRRKARAATQLKSEHVASVIDVAAAGEGAAY